MRRIIVLLAAALWCGSVQAQVPRQINYQGFLTNPSNTPVNGQVAMTVKLYNVAAGGSPLYSETQTVTVANGEFGVLIGAVTPLTLPFDGPYYLGITVGADPEMTPRQPLAASPYALRAMGAETVNGTSGLRLEPNGTSPNHVAGYAGNSVTAGAVGASIGGGGKTGTNCGYGGATVLCQNRVTDDYGTVGGGLGNAAGNNSGTMSDAPYATVGGGLGNRADDKYATIGGGAYNIATGSSALEDGATVGGGTFNEARNATIGGGSFNFASGDLSTISGGGLNEARGSFSTISGGAGNRATGYAAAVGGGVNNAAGDYGFAAGRRAKALRPGMFVWADASDVDFDMTQWRAVLSQNDNTFNVRATGAGGVFFATAVNGSTGQPLWGCYTANGNGWTCTSDRHVKRNLRPIDTQDALAKVSNMPVYRWQPLAGPNSELEHMGPMAQDFYAAFGLGDSDKSIGLLDVAGVALAAIQGLNAKLEERIAELEQDRAVQIARIEALEQQASEMAMLKQQMAQFQAARLAAAR